MIAELFERREDGFEKSLGTVNVKEVKGESDFDLVERSLEEAAKKLLNADMVSMSLKRIFTNNECISSFLRAKGSARSEYGRNSAVIDTRRCESDEYQWPDACIIQVEGEPDVKDAVLGVNLYREGYVLNTGKTGTSFLGSTFDAYVTKIGTNRTIKSGVKSAAKCYDLKGLLKVLTEKEAFLKAFVSQLGYRFSVEPASDKYKDMLWNAEVDKPKLRAKNTALRAEIDELLDRINGVTATAPDVVTADTPEAEAFNRMVEMHLMKPVLKRFLDSGELYMSEFGGILYDLNADAKEAVNRAKEYGLPYHVVRNQTGIGDMYSVLYVSNHKEEWETEHRDPATGIIPACVYNTSLPLAEIGDIEVLPANGGLQRVG